MNINDRFKLRYEEEDEVIHVDEIKGMLIPTVKDLIQGECQSVFIKFSDLYGASKSLCVDPREIVELFRQFGEEIKSASNTLDEVENDE